MPWVDNDAPFTMASQKLLIFGGNLTGDQFDQAFQQSQTASASMSDNQQNILPPADSDKIASILNTLNCDYTLQMLHNMQRPTVISK